MSEAAGAAAATGTGTPAAGGAPAGSPPPSGAPAGGAPQGTPAQDWLTGCNDDLKGYIQNKGFPSAAVLAESYRNAEKLLSTSPEQIIKLPTRTDDQAGWDAVYSRLGRPAQSKDYKVGPEKGGDENFIKFAQETFHKTGLTATQGSTIAKAYEEYATNVQKAADSARGEQNAQQESSLKKEWGMAFEQNTKIAKNAALAFGLDEQTIDQLEKSMGFAKTIKFMHSLGVKLGEDKFVTGGAQGTFRGAMTPEQAQSRLKDLRNDHDFIKRFERGGVAEREEWDKLNRYAYGHA